jgi:hypothetical protein
MKRFLTIFCAIAFSGAALSAQNDTIKVSRNGSDTLLIVVKEKQSIDRQARKEQRLAEKAQKPAYMINVGYNRGYRADIELSWANKSIWGITSSHGFSFGNGLYVGGGSGFGAELSKNTAAAASVADEVIDPEYSYTQESNWNASYFVPVFADIKYSFTKAQVAPFVSMKGGAIADITNKGIRTFANPAIGLDIARFSLKVGYEYQLGFWGYLDGKHMHNVKLGVAYTF